MCVYDEGGLQTCPRCRWSRKGDQWKCAYGKFISTAGESPETVVWLAERPLRLQGAWGLGCTICAWFTNKAIDEPQPKRGVKVCRVATRFSRFEVRCPNLQAEYIRQHADYA